MSGWFFKNLRVFGYCAALAAAGVMLGAAESARPGEREDYVHAPLPPGFQVITTEVDGPLFADAQGKTLYTWPSHSLRNGDAGEQRGRPTCDDHKYTETAGLMSPYPPGLELPEVETRPTCAQVWPPALAAADAKPVGQWTIIKRPDGRSQWAYDGYALYTSALDHGPGDVNGGDRLEVRGDAPAVRQPVGPMPNVPPQFSVIPTTLGRLLATSVGYSVYTFDKDGADKSNCDAACLREWAPVLAAAPSVSQGEWTVFERAPGIKQWAFRKKPLYTRVGEENFHSLEGSDISGWQNVYTQKAPALPKDLIVQDNRAGQVVADSKGHTIYIYHCGDDAQDQLACDNPDSPQAYRFAVCGGGDPAKCLQAFPYVIVSPGVRSNSHIWSVMEIDPKTGHRAPGQAGALHVWAYRGRPVFTFYRDQQPGEMWADGWGEFNGWRNGFKAFWLRDDFRDNNA